MQSRNLCPDPHRPARPPSSIPQRGHPAPSSYAALDRRQTTRASVVCQAKAKGPQVQYVCRECGARSYKASGRCPNCKEFDTLERQEVYGSGSPSTGGGAAVSAMQRAMQQSREMLQRVAVASDDTGGDEDMYEALMRGASPGQDTLTRSWLSNTKGHSSPVSLKRLSQRGSVSPGAMRMVLTGKTGQEVNRVLGGGLVNGSFLLIGGEPGVGKSTLTLQIAAMVAQPDLDFDALTEVPPHEVTTLSQDEVQAESPPGTDAEGSCEEDKPLRSRAGRKARSRSAAAAVTADPPASGSDHTATATATATASPAPPAPSLPQPASPQPRVVLYVSGEETCEQVYDRSARMGLQDCETLFVLAESRMDVILAQALQTRPAALVVDSLQTMYLPDLDNASGQVVQLKECCKALVQLAKEQYITVIATGHVTKSSDIAGPKIIEHMVDAVLRLEGDMSQSYRLLRAGKNRFGTTDEVGVFTMDRGGLHAVANPSAMFLANRSNGSSAVAVILDGTRVLVLEVQALVTACYANSNAPPIRQVSGVPKDRVFAIIISVLHKFVARMSNQNVVVNVTGGMTMREPAGDLAIAVAIAASYYDIPVPKDIAAIGEVDLGGGLRPVRGLDMRLVELAKLGLREIVIPNVPQVAKLKADPRLSGVTLTPCSTLLEALRVVLGEEVGRTRGKTLGKGAAGQKNSKQGGPVPAAMLYGNAAEEGDDDLFDQEDM